MTFSRDTGRPLHRVLLPILVAALLPACDGGGPTGVILPGFSLSAIEGGPGTPIDLAGLPAGVDPSTHWVEFDGERTPLIPGGGDAMFVLVPLFLEGASLWPSVPQAPVSVELHGPRGAIAVAQQRFTVQPLKPAAGTVAALAGDLATVVRALRTISGAIPPSAGEAARFPAVIAAALDSVQHSQEFSLSVALAELQATAPDALPLADALIAASGGHLGIQDLAHRLEGVASSITAVTPAGATATPPGVAAATVEVLSDETLAMLMQFAFYLAENVDLQLNLARDVSSTFGLLGLTGITSLHPTFKALAAIVSTAAAGKAFQAIMLNKFLVAALPSVVDSLTLQLASTTLAPGERTTARVEVHASNRPDPITLGDAISVFRIVGGIVGKPDYFEKMALFIIGKTANLLKAYAQDNPGVDYDSDIVDLWSVPHISFMAVVRSRPLLDLNSREPAVVEPLADAVDWVARADTTAETSISVETSAGDATIPLLAQWWVNVVTINSGLSTSLVLGSFGADIKRSSQVPVRVEATEDDEVIDVSGAWTLVVDVVCTGPLTVNQTGSALALTGQVGGAQCPFSASGIGTGTLDGMDINFGIAFGTDGDGAGINATFGGTVGPGGTSMAGTYSSTTGQGNWTATKQ